MNNRYIDQIEGNEKVFDALKNIESQKNKILTTVGYMDSLGSSEESNTFENLRKQCADILKETYKQSEKQQIQEKIQEIELLEITAFHQKISETMQESGWKESEEIYSSLIEKLQQSTLNKEIKKQFFNQLFNNLEITQKHLNEKNFIQEQEEYEKNIIEKISYEKSIPMWDSLLKKYEERLKTTSLHKYKNHYQEKILDIKGKKILAETYAKIKRTKDEKYGADWETAQDIYSKLIDTVKKIPEISEEISQEKNSILLEISQYKDIAQANVLLKQKHKKLIKTEEKIKKLGYRKSKKYWESLELYYRFLKEDSKKIIGSEKRVKIFETKEIEMYQNVQISDLHGQLENSKEIDNWETSLTKYSRIINETKKADIPKNEKQSILEKAYQYYEIAKTNKETKKTLCMAKSEISYAIENLDWEESRKKHFYVQETIQSINIKLLEHSKTKKIDLLMQEISNNIEICTKEIQKEKEENQEFSIEKIISENPTIRYLYGIFLAGTFQRKSQISMKNDREGTEDVLVSSDKICIQEKKQNTESSNTFIVDLNPEKFSGETFSSESTQLLQALNNNKKFQFAHSGLGILLHSQESQLQYLSELMSIYHNDFSSYQFKNFLQQKQSQSISKSLVESILY